MTKSECLRKSEIQNPKNILACAVATGRTRRAETHTAVYKNGLASPAGLSTQPVRVVVWAAGNLFSRTGLSGAERVEGSAASMRQRYRKRQFLERHPSAACSLRGPIQGSGRHTSPVALLLRCARAGPGSEHTSRW